MVNVRDDGDITQISDHNFVSGIRNSALLYNGLIAVINRIDKHPRKQVLQRFFVIAFTGAGKRAIRVKLVFKYGAQCSH